MDEEKVYQETAATYDEEAEKYGWRGSEVLFGMMYTDLVPGRRLLDLGTGTGLSCELFHKAGLAVTGLDRSEPMLQILRQKGFAEAILVHDLGDLPLPLSEGAFHYVTCTGVLPFVGPLDDLFAESARLLAPGGVMGFMFVENRIDDQPLCCDKDEETGMSFYRHSLEGVRGGLVRAGLTLLRDVGFQAFEDKERTRAYPCQAWVVRKD